MNHSLKDECILNIEYVIFFFIKMGLEILFDTTGNKQKSSCFKVAGSKSKWFISNKKNPPKTATTGQYSYSSMYLCMLS